MLGVTDTAATNALDDGSLGNAGVSSAVQAVVSMYGPSDFTTMNVQAQVSCPVGAQDHDGAGSPESLWLGDPVQSSPLAATANLTTWVKSAKTLPPFLLVHGSADCLVPPGQSQELADALAAAGGNARVVVLPGLGHGGAVDLAGNSDAETFLVEQLAATPPVAAQTTTASQQLSSSAPVQVLAPSTVAAAQALTSAALPPPKVVVTSTTASAVATTAPS
jgi:acetyl esterase/lipase